MSSVHSSAAVMAGRGIPRAVFGCTSRSSIGYGCTPDAPAILNSPNVFCTSTYPQSPDKRRSTRSVPTFNFGSRQSVELNR